MSCKMTLFGNKEEKIIQFASRHPGGCRNLLMATTCSKDEAKMLFMSYHTGKNLSKIEKIAKLNGLTNIPIKNCSQSPLFQDIHEIFVNVVNKYWIHGVIYNIYATLLCIIFVFSLIYNIFYCCLCNTLLLSFIMVSYSFVVFHTRHHFNGNIFFNVQSSYINLLKLYFDFFDNTFAIPPKQWILSHQLSHHIYTNSDIDSDIIGRYPILRLSETTNKFKKQYFHKYQWLYCIFLFMLNFIYFRLKNIKKKKYRVDKNTIDISDGHPVCFFIYLLILIILPFYYNGIYAMKVYVTSQCVVSLLVGILLQVSHHVTDIKHNNVPNTIKNYDSWVKSQIEESMSWGGYIATLIFGGINFQIEHHVAPAILPIYYYFAHAQIKNVCKKYNIKYIYYTNLFSAFYQYEKYVFDINY